MPLMVLIPLLVDDPLWAKKNELTTDDVDVLIPLLVDDPLWAKKNRAKIILIICLNPSFSG